VEGTSSEEDKNNAESVRSELADLLQENEHKVPGLCSLPEAIVTLEVKPGTKAVSVPQYPLPVAVHAAVDEVVSGWLERGVVRAASAGTMWNSPITAVPKHDEQGRCVGTRVCCDLRALNRVLVEGDNFPLPDIHDLLRSFAGAQFFAMLDLKEAFLQFPLHPRDQHKISFCWRGRQYSFTRAVFGLSFMSQRFQRVMAGIFADLPDVRVFVDNIGVASKSLDEHIRVLRIVVRRLSECGMQLKISKCVFAASSMSALGLVVSRKGIDKDPTKVRQILEWPLPHSGAEMQSFMGLASYLRVHVPAFATLSRPFTALYAQKVISWSDELKGQFERLRAAIAEGLLLVYPDFGKTFVLTTDASDVGIGLALSQPDNPSDAVTDHLQNVVLLASRTLLPYERNYSVYKKELLAVVWALRKCHTFLWGRPFVLQTDHQALTFLSNGKSPNRTVESWLEILQDYSFSVTHRPGAANVVADALSRARVVGALGNAATVGAGDLDRRAGLGLGDIGSVGGECETGARVEAVDSSGAY
jgi:hypothetical protein